jgi:hypothetical protein
MASNPLSLSIMGSFAATKFGRFLSSPGAYSRIFAGSTSPVSLESSTVMVGDRRDPVKATAMPTKVPRRLNHGGVESPSVECRR